jgi:pimeloyl-ACP methyl ester carboxylesterase
MASSILLVATLVAVSGLDDRPLIRFGANLSRGVLVNLSPDAHPGHPPDRSRPTVVFIHGFNPLPRTVHFTMTEQLAVSFARRGGPRFNVLSWEWNAATFSGLSPRSNAQSTIRQGQRLAAALREAGIEPSRTLLIGHSSGAIVAASAARTILVETGRMIAQLTLLDPALMYHDVVFGQLAAGSAARHVENYWAPGLSGYGRQVGHAGVWNHRIDGPRPVLGMIFPRYSEHLNVVRWYLSTVENPAYPGGFNQGLFHAESLR